ncbi:MAG TPA: Ni/Fe hydrogenase subunit alpha, partial [Anaerolineaceae bacterium]|nr:Ni/Fe hydrogenase subunit alpha [Anaerolineaceae bacterium]
IRNVVGLIQTAPDLTVKAVRLRKFGQEIIKTLGGRKIHPDFPVPGGVNKALTVKERDEILSLIDENIATTQVGIKIMKDWAAEHIEDINKFAVLESGYLGLVTPNNGLELSDGIIRLKDSQGQELERFEGRNYLDYIAEHVEPWSYLKFPYYKKFGFPGGVYRVGPLGRLNNADIIETPLAAEEMKYWKSLNNGKPVGNTLYYHLARMIEALFALERVRILCEDPDILSTDIINTRQYNKGEGVGVIEAPRGTLFHHYWANANGQLERVNLIVSTGHNNWAMSTAVDSVAKTYIDGPVTEGMLNRVEAAIRAHDPCLSCSTHAVGQMPIEIEVLDAEGKLVNTVKRGL